MRTPLKLVLFGLSFAAVFAVMFAAGRAFIPDSAVSSWVESAEETAAEHAGMSGDGTHGPIEDDPISGVSIESSGYVLRDLSAPTKPRAEGRLSFRISTPEGTPLTRYEERHEKELHLITVRADGAGYRHAHPSLDPATGTWSMPWQWRLGGTQRVYVDFAPAGEAEGVTLTRSFDVEGEFKPRVSPTRPSAVVHGFKVELSGTLETGSGSELDFSISRDGQPVESLQPYLGAFGHLVVLREGDLAYLHAHADVDEDMASHGTHGTGQPHGGPELRFSVGAPTSGRYLLYLDFKVDGIVHTAEFTTEAK